MDTFERLIAPFIDENCIRNPKPNIISFGNLAKRVAASRIHIDENTTLKDIEHCIRYPKPNIMSVGELLPHQIDHAYRLKYMLLRRGIAADTSKPGTGKTYVASKIAADLGLPVLVFCPKPIMTRWYEVMRMFGNSVVTVTNYDMARSSHSDSEVKWYDMRDGYTEVPSICPWVTKRKMRYKGKDKTIFRWRIPYKCLIIFDEEHVGKNVHTQTFGMIDGAVEAAKRQGHYILYASATPVEKRDQLKSILKLLDVIDRPDAAAVKRFFSREIGSSDMGDIHRYLYAFNPADPMKGTGCMSWMPEAEIPANITNTVRSVAHEIDAETMAKIAKYTREIMEARARLRNKVFDNSLGRLNANRTYIEKLKVPLLARRAREMLKQGYWVPIFVNHKFAVEELKKDLETDYKVATIYGSQSTQEVDEAVRAFNSGECRVIICTISKGGQSISLHDTSEGGIRPRFSLISIPTSATQLVQALGRCYRTNVTSSCITEIPICKGDVVEESIARLLNSKSHDISKFTIGKENDFNIYVTALESL